MLTQEHIQAAKEEAEKQVHEVEFKKAVAEHKEALKARKAHFFPKKFVLQLPFRLEDWHKPKCCNGKCN